MEGVPATHAVDAINIAGAANTVGAANAAAPPDTDEAAALHAELLALLGFVNHAATSVLSHRAAAAGMVPGTPSQSGSCWLLLGEGCMCSTHASNVTFNLSTCINKSHQC